MSKIFLVFTLTLIILISLKKKEADLCNRDKKIVKENTLPDRKQRYLPHCYSDEGLNSKVVNRTDFSKKRKGHLKVRLQSL